MLTDEEADRYTLIQTNTAAGMRAPPHTIIASL
jgi:hypothetical protein